MSKLSDSNIRSIVPIVPPKKFLERFLADKELGDFVLNSRRQIVDILTGKDPRMLAIVGPCSMDRPEAGLEYAKRLAELSQKLNKKLFIVMRAYPEKSRTRLAWPGYMQRPNLKDLDMENGLYGVRDFLEELAKLRLPVATEFVDSIASQYLALLVSWVAVGARAVENQGYRDRASGLSMPVGFKNSISGNIQTAVDAIVWAQNPNSFLGIDFETGQAAIFTSEGNPYSHLVLRGGDSGPNYDSTSVADAIIQLEKAQLSPHLVIDCSHGNSQKIAERQIPACNAVLAQRLAGNKNI
ncbi:MAG: 3-deoxy-7-phosphoheptulonate synthase, partial [bacterium]|nr:3-deoxy-7-phosphoheptulonate synthase [bacterium]